MPVVAFQVHTLPMRMDPRLYTGTSVVFFAVGNTVKVAPHAALVKRMRASVFHQFMYAMITLVVLTLVHDGAAGLI